MSQKLPGSADQIRGLVPAARESWAFINGAVIHAGLVEQSLKDLCYRFLAGELSEAAIEGALGRERAALEWARAIAWDSDRADDALWARLHELFTEPELVDLGCAIGFELGQQHWRRSVGLSAR